MRQPKFDARVDQKKSQRCSNWKLTAAVVSDRLQNRLANLRATGIFTTDVNFTDKQKQTQAMFNVSAVMAGEVQ